MMMDGGVEGEKERGKGVTGRDGEEREGRGAGGRNRDGQGR